MAQDEARSTFAQLTVEVRETFEEKLRPRPRFVAAVKQPVVQAEDRDDAVVSVQRRSQRRVIIEPKVAAKPDERGAQVSLATRMTSLAGASKTSSRRKSSAIAV